MNGTLSRTLSQTTRLTATAVLLAASLEVHAIPTQLTSAQFATQLAGAGSIVVENFEGMTGASGNPLTFANGAMTTDNGDAFVWSTATFCGTTPDNCLIGQNIDDTRTVGALPAGTTLWGADIYFIRETDLIKVTVMGGSGVLSFTSTGSSFAGFIGFGDALGITSIGFHNLGTPGGSSGNYSLDNVTTAGASRVSVPEPATLSLLGAGLIAFGLARRRRAGEVERRAHT